MNNPHNTLGIKVGDLVIALTNESDTLAVSDVYEFVSDDGTPCPKFRHVDSGHATYAYFRDFAVLSVNTATQAVEKAQEKLRKAEAILKDAVEKAEAAKKFTEADVKPGLIVEWHGGGYRLLIKRGVDSWSLVDVQNWSQASGAGSKEEMVGVLNSMYKRTDKNLAEVAA